MLTGLKLKYMTLVQYVGLEPLNQDIIINMKIVYFATTNQEKLLIAKTVCEQASITVKQTVFDIDEIQGEDPELIVKDKARRAYEKLGKPVVVSDDSWNIPALNGFPGPY